MGHSQHNRRYGQPESSGPSTAAIVGTIVLLVVGVVVYIVIHQVREHRKRDNDTADVTQDNSDNTDSTDGNPLPLNWGALTPPNIGSSRPPLPGGNTGGDVEDPAPARPGLPNRFRETNPEGGFIGNIDFREFREDGSILIGFDLNVSNLAQWNTDVLAYLRPIYRTATGEQYGTAYGRAIGRVQTVKAKEGYALAGVRIAGGGHLEGLALTFMRVGSGGLDTTDSYVSEWFGEQRRKPADDAGMRSGDGSVVVGICGKRFEDQGGNTLGANGGVSSLGLIVIPSRSPSAPSTPTPSTSGPKVNPPRAELPKFEVSELPPPSAPLPMAALPPGWRQSKALGGIFANKEFREFRDDGSLLIGFEVGTGRAADTDIIAYLRPIWLTPAKTEELGVAYGKKPANAITVKAKDGYAVNGLLVTGGGAMEGIAFSFAKIVPKKGLSTIAKECYASDWYGEQSRMNRATSLPVLGGFPVVGIHGKRFEDRGGDNYDDSGAIGSIGLIAPSKADGWQVAAPAPEKPPAIKPERSKLMGGGSPELAFDDTAPAGGWLIGVEVDLGKFFDSDVIASVRPIFLTGDKVSTGTRHGKETDRLVRAVAKPGYAVGAINVKAGAGVDGFSFTFMKVTAKGKLDPTDSYESDWIGGQGGGPKTKIGEDAAPVLGLCGRVNDGQHVGGIGIIVATAGK